MGFFPKLRAYFPISAAETRRRLDEADAVQAAILKQQEQEIQQINALQNSLNQITQAIGTFQSEQTNIIQQIADMSKVTNDIDKQVSANYDKSVELSNEIHNDISDMNNNIIDIKQGDLFRRIEFLQERFIFLQNELQKNLLSPEDQMRSTEYRQIASMRTLFPVMQVDGEHNYVRIGRPHDGGYVMLNDFKNRKIAYSIGICDDVSWDKDMAERGFDVYMYDHTIDGLPEENPKFHFYQIGLGTTADKDDPQLMTLDEMILKNGHQDEHGMILKIDIEGAEWPVLGEISKETLSRFSQIVFEFHGLTFAENEEKIQKAMKNLNATHQMVHIHANNYGGYLQVNGKVLPELIEGTYLLKDEYSLKKEARSFPEYIDEINCDYMPEIILGNWDT